MAEVSPGLRGADSMQGKDPKPPLTASPTQSPVVEKFTFARLPRQQAKGNVKDEPPMQRTDPSDSTQAELASQQPSELNRRATVNQPVNSAPNDLPFSIDPLSQHILSLSGNSNAKYGKSSDPVGSTLNQSASQNSTIERTSTEPMSIDETPVNAKDKKKGGSLLSRFIGNKRRETLEATDENGDFPEGTDAQLFYEPVEYVEYSPRHPQPPAYIKVRSHSRKEKEFSRVFLAQELEDKVETTEDCSNASLITESRIKGSKKDNGGAVWALEYSKDGKYIATGGQDKIVRVWATLSSKDDRRLHEEEEQEQSGPEAQKVRLSAPVFRKRPVKQFDGHTSAVLDLSWSKNNFLLSSAMDKTVRLWHVSRAECLCAFKHSDFVTSIQFHPRDDRFFLAGSLDSKIRLWSIPDKSVALWNQVTEMITAVGFSPDGKTAIAGTLNGLCLFYETEGLKYQSHFQIRKKSNYGKTVKGSKITGIQTINMPPSEANGEVKLLITSNDSRIRLYHLRDKMLEAKFKGHENMSSQIQARFSDDGRYIICGSEDKKVYIWSVKPTDAEKKDKRPVEIFEAHSTITTAAAFGPTRTRQLLSASEDPVYDICNPPPVTLMSRSESMASSKPATEASANVNATPELAATIIHRSSDSPAPTPGYITRTAHPNGQIITTADAAGTIRIFRQDCAYEKRKRASETSKFPASAGALRRASSLATQSSDRSRQESVGGGSAPRERILSWRQGIASSASLERASATGEGRSASPRKAPPSLPASDRRIPSLSREHSDPAIASNASSPALPPTSAKKVDGARKRATSLSLALKGTVSTSPKPASPAERTPPPAPEIKVRPPLPEREDSDAYWRKQAWQDQMVDQLQNAQTQAWGAGASATRRKSSLEDENGLLALPSPAGEADALHPLGREITAVSRLSSEASSDVGEVGGDDDVQHEAAK